MHTKPRISYICGPGDIAGTFEHWRMGQQDPRIPVITYSSQFFSLVEQLEASAQIITRHKVQAPDESRFRFDQVDGPQLRNRLGYFFAPMKYADRVKEKIDDYDPHIVLTTTDFAPFTWHKVSKNRKFVVTAHNTFWPMGHDPNSLKERLKYFLLTIYARKITDAICTSDECARQVKKITKGHVQGLVEFPQVVKKYEKKRLSQVRNLLFLGRIENVKGVFLLLEAFKRLHAKHRDLTLTFAGDGNARADLERQVDAYGSDNLRFVGLLDSEGVHTAIHAADLVVCPTTSAFKEGLALVGLEAAAHGVPVLLSSVVPARELLGKGCAVFKADSLESLTSELAALIRDDDRYVRLGHELDEVRPRLYDRNLAWGSQLFQVLARL